MEARHRKTRIQIGRHLVMMGRGGPIACTFPAQRQQIMCPRAQIIDVKETRARVFGPRELTTMGQEHGTQ